MQKITTTIERQWLKEIVAGRKHTEYREIKPYWEKRFSAISTPFHLRLINGMQKNAPEVVVEVLKIVRNKRHRRFELRLGKVISVRNWNKRLERPAAS